MDNHTKSNSHSANQTYIPWFIIKRRTLKFFLALFLIAGLTDFTTEAQKTSEWPAFHGSDRTNKSSETGLLKVWPKDGPQLAWTASGLGEGYSSV
jgi:hypothetical protein